MEKVAPSERFRSELDDVLVGVDEEQDPIEVVGRLGAARCQLGLPVATPP